MISIGTGIWTLGVLRFKIRARAGRSGRAVVIRSSKFLILVDLTKGAHDGGRVIVPSRPRSEGTRLNSSH